MNYPHSAPSVLAPCIIESGILVNPEDIYHLLSDLNYVKYVHTLDGQEVNRGCGWILDVFMDPRRSTVIANQSLYLNVQSFDYLQICQISPEETHFELIQEQRRLCLIPLGSPVQNRLEENNLEANTLESMLNQVLSAKWDVQWDEDSPL